MKKIVICLILALGFTNFVNAEAVLSLRSSQSLFSLCDEKSDTASFLVCGSYIQGAFDMLMINLDNLGIDTICSGDTALVGVTPYQLSKMFVKDLIENPKDLNVAPSALLSMQILKNFPIPKKCYTKK